MKRQQTVGSTEGSTRAVDIVIPVYNAFPYLERCIASVLRHTDLKKHRLILIDDCSTESEIPPYLRQVKANLTRTRENIVLLRNKNRGWFVRTVNRGLAYSKTADVIILNTDTEVTARWVEKLQTAAYSCASVASVTPLSYFETNYLTADRPDIEASFSSDYSVDTFGELIEKRSMVLYPEIPVSVGFCSYIRREALTAVGLFDAETFPKGYGEETDFCMRARRAGFIHILDDSTFIYHKGSASYTTSRRSLLVEKNEHRIHQKYPEYKTLIAEFGWHRPIDVIHQNLKFWMENDDRDRNKILVIKNLERTPGGIGLSTQALLDALSTYIFYVLSPRKNDSFLLERFSDHTVTASWVFSFTSPQSSISQSRRSANLVSKILVFFGIDLVHIQHLLGYPLDLLTVPAQSGIPSVLSVHDNYLVSNSVFLEKPNGTTFYRSVDDYQKTIMKKRKQYSGEIGRIAHMRSLLRQVDLLICPSRYQERQLDRVFSNIAIAAIEPGASIPKQPIPFSKSPFTKRRSRRPTIAFVGTSAMHKGTLDFLKLASDRELRKHTRWKIIGSVDDNVKKILDKQHLTRLFAELHVHDDYLPRDLPVILADEQVDVVILPSACPETYSIVLSECLQCNIPVLGRNLGAIGERIRALKCGWTYDTLDEAKSILIRIAQDPETISAVRARVYSIEIPSMDMMAEKIGMVYRKLVKEKKLSEHAQVRSPETSRFLFTFAEKNNRGDSKTTATRRIRAIARKGKTALRLIFSPPGKHFHPSPKG